MKKIILIIALAVLSFTAYGQYRITPDRYNEYKLGAYTFTRDNYHHYVCELGLNGKDEMNAVWDFMMKNEAKIENLWNVEIAYVFPCDGYSKDGPGCGHSGYHIHVRMQDKDDLEAENRAYELKKAKEEAEMRDRINSLAEIF